MFVKRFQLTSIQYVSRKDYNRTLGFHKVCSIPLHVHLRVLLCGESEFCVSKSDSYWIVPMFDRCFTKSTGTPALHKIVQTNKSYDVSQDSCVRFK